MNDNFSFFNKEKNNSIDNSIIANMLSKPDEIDLLGIYANNYLSKIKTKIGRTLDQSKSKNIDDNFKESLKKIIIINNNNVTDEELTELSYIYFALYNNTLDVYHEIKSKGESLEYYMLDEKFNNNINNTEETDWNKYGNNKKLLSLAYKQGLEDEVLSILKLNPNFVISSCGYDALYFFGECKFFKKIVDLVGVEVIAKSNFDLLRIAIEENHGINYIRQLVEINPNIAIDLPYIFDVDLKANFDINQIAFFTDKNKKVICYIQNYPITKKLEGPLYAYYSKLIEIEPDFEFYDIDKEIFLLRQLILCNIELPANIYINLTEEERDKMYELAVRIKRRKIDIISQERLCNLVEKAKRQYGEPKQKKLKK